MPGYADPGFDTLALHAGAAPDPGQLQPGMEMRTQEMPTQAEWDVAAANAGHLFGEHVSPFLTPAGVADLAERVRARVGDAIEPARTPTRRPDRSPTLWICRVRDIVVITLVTEEVT